MVVYDKENIGAYKNYIYIIHTHNYDELRLMQPCNNIYSVTPTITLLLN